MMAIELSEREINCICSRLQLEGSHKREGVSTFYIFRKLRIKTMDSYTVGQDREYANRVADQMMQTQEESLAAVARRGEAVSALQESAAANKAEVSETRKATAAMVDRMRKRKMYIIIGTCVTAVVLLLLIIVAVIIIVICAK